MKLNRAYILLGANLGKPIQQLQAAVADITKLIGEVVQISSLYESAAWGIVDQPSFINQVLSVDTELSACALLQTCQQIENKLGRVRDIKWGARVIDIDILYFNNDIVDKPDLTIPHPYIRERRFTLIPLVEIAPNYINPVLKQTNDELLQDCLDQSSVHQLYE
ncbi:MULTISPECIES: 2-amino-4-hydroxy-6-hydroxymethyldihydropteridine diphosphokinase [Sphingobacterium]|uniref:2-amino-4-hydroxy-6-hydroxymethyldihydropteridine pyrophosphokinase n=1 Tax=Sphingobacterium populi TaxID=1812824 RepID=A0ABW5U7I4_9SPHI|nr:2-amino-4-hydroxy-6-hydroxymethyldihydropteridine diphosphokinase [Sphingobacterium sp. CFCC 11742]